MNKETFAKKYDKTIRGIAIANGDVDMSVAESMLEYEIKVRLGIVERADTYKGISNDFDWETAKADYNTLYKK